MELKLTDKELVWAYDFKTGPIRVLGFYDKENDSIFTLLGKRDGEDFTYYEPYEDEWPEWAKEAYEKLED